MLAGGHQFSKKRLAFSLAGPRASSTSSIGKAYSLRTAQGGEAEIIKRIEVLHKGGEAEIIERIEVLEKEALFRKGCLKESKKVYYHYWYYEH